MVLWRSATAGESSHSGAAPLHHAIEGGNGDEDESNTTTAASFEDEDSPEKSSQSAIVQQQNRTDNTTEAEPPDTADTSIDTENSPTGATEIHPAGSGGDSSSSISNSNTLNGSNSSSSNNKSKKRKAAPVIEGISLATSDNEEGADHAEDIADDFPTIVWKPHDEQSTCEFTHTIFNYAQKRESGCKTAEYSAITQDSQGNRWRLIVYVNGNGRASNHHLSLFLQVADADELPFGWKKAVSYVLTLEHPTDSSISFAKRNPDKTFKLCPKAIDWGWSQFITSDRIQQDGFVSNDSLIVRAHVSVKSSSISIDEEDSELYLKCAVEDGDAKSVKLCLDQGASVNCQFKDDLYTPLHTACSSGTTSGSLEVLDLLLEEGSDCNACNKWRESPLLIAANNGHRAAVEALLKHGADPSLCSEAGWSALTFAAHKGYDDIVALLLRSGAPVNCPVIEDASTPLHKACAGSKPGHLAAVKLLLDNGADVHGLNKWRETPLLTAANHGQTGAVKALLAANADPCKCTDTGWSPLSIAAYKGHDECVRLLLEEGAPTEEEDPTLSALLQAATKGLPDTVELLLSYGADHTVTTKKGDTALSILVEQNLIDAAVEMVTEYNASIPRCSRDRKKVQRARLLINLRMKQIEREGRGGIETVSEEEEGDYSQPDTDPNGENGSSGSASISDDGMRKKTIKGKAKSKSAEERAKAAEAELLRELEKEDQEARKEDAKAATKQAKKKKQKERQRLQKIKEEEERRVQQEREAQEREMIRKEKEEKLRKEREVRLQAERERELREMQEREKLLEAKRKEREKKEKKVRQRDSGSLSPFHTRLSVSEKLPKHHQQLKHAVTDPTPYRKIISTKGANQQDIPPSVTNRRWEISAKIANSNHFEEQSIDAQAMTGPLFSSRLPSSTPVVPSILLSPRLSQPLNGQNLSNSNPLAEKGASPDVVSNSHSTVSCLKGSANIGQLTCGAIEHPTVAIFRREKVMELLQMCHQSLGLVDDKSMRRVLYRWIVRASHGKYPYSDPIVPSWLDSDVLVAYFQRQFISEARRLGTSLGGQSMEALKEAGSKVAILCQNLALQVKEFRQNIDGQLSSVWTDTTEGMTATDNALTSPTVVTISWAAHSQAFVSSNTFCALRDRYIGPPSRFLASVFVAKIWYETAQMIVANTNMDFCFSPSTQAWLSTEIGVTAELWSNPFSAYKSHIFWGRFEEVDALFGGQKPFGSDEQGSEEVLAIHGGSLSAFLPLDTMVASQYVQRMVDILDTSNLAGVPVSFIVVLCSDCFLNSSERISADNLCSLDPRLGNNRSTYISRAETLEAGRHIFSGGDNAGTNKRCETSSLLVVFQNDPGRLRFEISETSFSRILSSMSLNLTNESAVTQPSGYFDEIDPISPVPNHIIYDDFLVTSDGTLPIPLSPALDGVCRSSRRGRLFDLVEDADEDHQQSEDIMTGMLNNLDLGLFSNSNTGSDNVDIEAISLMGIGVAPPHSLSNSGNTHSSRSFG